MAYSAFWGFVFVYSLRVNISVAMVCMHAEFDWDKTLRSSMLASFFYGYIVTQIPGGWLADKFGGKRVLGIAMLISSIATIILPVCARQSYIAVYVLRVILGLATELWLETSQHFLQQEFYVKMVLTMDGDQSSISQTARVPWKSILTSRAVWACLTAHICNNWTNYTLLTSLPAFMKEALHFDIKQRTGFMSCNQRYLAVAFLSLAVMFTGLCRAGYNCNHVDFAPKYAGVLFGLTNTLATIPGMVAPIVAGALTPNQSPEEWRNVFYVCAGFDLFGALMFGFFSSGELEPWARDPDVEFEVEPDKEVDKQNVFFYTKNKDNSLDQSAENKGFEKVPNGQDTN
ncbi:hypothetical protein KUTeg_001589 [Tegillarca granosa]|uniref:Major facilitator superfamily (MFS) profile domain-containing protein n=1 Tax=Tegillarca granosa TaxID=220873 RepID=A0ABQ9FRV2_TEGGR|nr:hypothetical protein KUTeg_001589 [Tegillarca granosa]